MLTDERIAGADRREPGQAAVGGSQRPVHRSSALRPERSRGCDSAGATSCQYGLFVLRRLHRAPEEFLTRPVVDLGDVRSPDAGPDSRLRRGRIPSGIEKPGLPGRT
jgi:hypothetical protein